MKIDQYIDQAFQPVAEFLSKIVFYGVNIEGMEFRGEDVEIKIILVWLAAAAIFFTVYLGFVNLRYFKHAFDVVRGKYDKDDDDGQISRFKALATSLSATIGLGNIGGVAIAVSVGGPGAVFWMIVMAFFSMTSKFVEVALGVKYRRHNDADHPEEISGGPMYYLLDGFSNRGLPFLGKFLAAMFAVLCIGGSLGGGNMYQANQAYQQLFDVTGGDTGFLADKGWLVGMGLAILVGVVIIGGIRSIANVAGRLVPIMGIIYLTIGIIVIAIHYQNIPNALWLIVSKSFTLEAGLGGLLGSILIGVQRAAFSNEAGLGSASIVHSTAKTNDHISQGFVGMLGPFIDTVIICLVTALVIVISGAYLQSDGLEGVQLTSRALESGVSWFPYVLALTVFLFAYSTMISWSYYGLKGVTYLFGHKDSIQLVYKFIFCGFIVIGASSNLTHVISFSDALLLSMGFPNIIAMYLLAPEIKKDLKDYIAKLKTQKL